MGDYNVEAACLSVKQVSSDSGGATPSSPTIFKQECRHQLGFAPLTVMRCLLLIFRGHDVTVAFLPCKQDAGVQIPVVPPINARYLA
jgi:hypothetical protein